MEKLRVTIKDEWIKKIRWIQWILSAKKEWGSAFYENVDGPREDYARVNKWDREWGILYDITYMESEK